MDHICVFELPKYLEFYDLVQYFSTCHRLALLIERALKQVKYAKVKNAKLLHAHCPNIRKMHIEDYSPAVLLFPVEDVTANNTWLFYENELPLLKRLKCSSIPKLEVLPNLDYLSTKYDKYQVSTYYANYASIKSIEFKVTSGRYRTPNLPVVSLGLARWYPEDIPIIKTLPLKKLIIEYTRSFDVSLFEVEELCVQSDNFTNLHLLPNSLCNLMLYSTNPVEMPNKPLPFGVRRLRLCNFILTLAIMKDLRLHGLELVDCKFHPDEMIYLERQPIQRLSIIRSPINFAYIEHMPLISLKLESVTVNFDILPKSIKNLSLNNVELKNFNLDLHSLELYEISLDEFSLQKIATLPLTYLKMNSCDMDDDMMRILFDGTVLSETLRRFTSDSKFTYAIFDILKRVPLKDLEIPAFSSMEIYKLATTNFKK